MSWLFAYRETYFLDRAVGTLRIPIVFQPGYRFVVAALPLTGLGSADQSLGKLRQLLLIPDLGEVKGDEYPLTAFSQLFTPSTEFTFELLFQPLKRLYSLELAFWVDSIPLQDITMPLTNPSAPNYPISTTANSTTVASSATSVAILAANPARKGALVWNASTATLYLDLDAAASLTDYAARLDPGGYYEVPFGYTGALSGIWSAANGNALVRELV